VPSRSPHLLLSIFVLCIVSPPSFSQQSPNACKDVSAKKAWDDAKSPVYQDAMQLARTLSQRGFYVECIRRSKEENVFEGQKGAAWFKTDQGIFEVWFLPVGESFADLQIVEESKGDGRFIYSFRGTPRILTHIDSSEPIVFIKQGNLLFEVWGDERLAASLRQAFQNLETPLHSRDDSAPSRSQANASPELLSW